MAMANGRTPSNAEIYRIVSEIKIDVRELHSKFDNVQNNTIAHNERIASIERVTDKFWAIGIGAGLALLGVVFQFLFR